MPRESVRMHRRHTVGESVKAGLLTVDWTMDWTVDWVFNQFYKIELDTVLLPRAS